jgi:hypothetical protein
MTEFVVLGPGRRARVPGAPIFAHKELPRETSWLAHLFGRTMWAENSISCKKDGVGVTNLSQDIPMPGSHMPFRDDEPGDPVQATP